MSTILNEIHRALFRLALSLAGPEGRAEWEEDDGSLYPVDDPWGLSYAWHCARQEAQERLAGPVRTYLRGCDYPSAPALPSPAPLAWWWMTARIFVSEWAGSALSPLLRDYCRKFGHGAMEDNGSWAGPDSGGEAYRCRRCGEAWSHVYY